jgi:hypothetical protein
MIDPDDQRRRIAALEESPDGAPIVDSFDVAVPTEILWTAFEKAHLWPRWNHCFCWVRNRRLEPGSTLVWVFEPIRPAYLYRMPAWARIVELEAPARVTWEVKAVPGMYARHTYFLTDLGEGRTRFGSWEKAMGGSYRLMKRFWDAHFWFVNRESLQGARRLERLYLRDGSLDRLSDAALP